MNVIQGTLTVNGRPRNGATAKLWRAEAFSSPPQQDTPEPADTTYQVGVAITTGPTYGGEGAYRFTGVDDGAYYVSLQVGSTIAWEGHVVSGGTATQEFPHRLKSQDHEYGWCADGDTITLFHAVGPGIVRQVFLAFSSTVKAAVEDSTTVKVFINNEGTPSISCPVSQFFAYTFEAEPFWTRRFAVTRKNYDDIAPNYERGAYRYLEIPYDSECRIVLEVEGGDTRVFSVVYYQELPAPQFWGLNAYLKGDYYENASVSPYTSVELLNATGKGRLDTVVLSVNSPDGLQFAEGNLEIYRDGETLPAVYVTGTEDITGNAFYWGPGDVNGPYQGSPVHLGGPPAQTTQYRIFELDRLDFDQSLRIVWWAGHKGQGAALVTPVSVKATCFYYLDQQPAAVVPSALDLLIEDTFDTYGEGQPIGGQWVQRSGVSQWVQQSGQARYTDVGVSDAWMYRQDTVGWTDYVVEAEVQINNFATGEIWLFARGDPSVGPDFNNRITFGLSANGAVPEHPNYTPVMAFVASGAVRDSSLLLLDATAVNVVRLEVFGGLVVVSLKRSVDTDFRELFRFTQSTLNSGVAGLSALTGDIAVSAFRVYRRVT